MKIAQVNVYFQPFMVGGAEWYVYNLSKELVKRGHEVHVFTASRFNGSTAPDSEMIDGISVHRIPLSVDWSYRMKVWDGLSEALVGKDFDVIHTYDYAQPHSLAAIRAGAKSHIATVLTVFDVHSMIPRVWFKRIPMKVMDGYMARRTLPAASMVLVRAPNLVEPLVEIGGVPDRIRVTPSGVRDESLGEFNGEGFKARHGIQGSPVVLYIGRMNPLKGPQYLVESAPSILRVFPKAQFVFVGPDQSGYQETLKAKADKLGIGPSFRFLGPIYDFAEKMSAYAACDVFTLPTSYEGTSQSIFEAMAQGKPVVSTKVGGVPYQISNGVEGHLVEYADVEALTAALLSILEEMNNAREMGLKGRKRVESLRYSILTTAIEDIYREVKEAN